MRLLISIFIFIFCDPLFAQDGPYLVPLVTNPNIEKEVVHQTSRSQNAELIYIIDTLQLPFIDDFSKCLQLKYNYQPGYHHVIDSAQSVYRINNVAKDTIKYLKSPTQSYYYSSITNRVDTFDNDSVEITIYNELDGQFSHYDYGWLPYEYYYSNGELVDTVSLSIYDSLLAGDLWYKYYVRDTSKHWIDNGAWINSTMAVNPPTIGVATFDGVDSTGHPYEFSSAASYGVGDHLTSYPLNLKNKSNVKLSFYYQAAGLGNEPESKDSLVLEFYADYYWHYVWSTPGKKLSEFQYVEIPISDSLYLYKGFQFRFKNYGTLSGSLDHWNIDYVYLNEDRPDNDIIFDDLGFKEVERTFLVNYNSVPYEHYVLDPSAYLKPEVNFTLTNLSSLNLSGLNKYTVYDKTAETSIFNSEEINFISFPASSIISDVHSVNSSNNNFQFPNSGLTRNTYRINYITVSNTIQASEINPMNDTITVEQIFDTYYAYDDGSPEQGFAVAGDGASVAYQFDLLSADTITGVLINLLEMFEDVDNKISIKIWQELSGLPGNVLYESVYYPLPTYSSDDALREPITFTRYELDTTLVLPAGKYYIGWTQERANKFFVGYDMNNDATDKFVYNVGGTWSQFDVPGAVMLRPEFGKANLKPIISANITELETNNEQKITIYPNPASDHIYVSSRNSEKVEVELYDLLGNLLCKNSLYSSEALKVDHLPNGMYLLNVHTLKGNLSSHKISISR